MNQQIQQIFKSKQKQGEKISLSKLRHKSKQEKIDQQTINRLQKLKKFTIHDTSIPTQKLNNYYCSLCGRINIVTNIILQTMPTRKTDNSIAIDLQGNFVKLNLQRDKVKYINRQTGVQVQHRWKCDCGIPIGYTTIGYDEIEIVRQSQQYDEQNRPFIYIYEGALVERMKQSKLITEIITYKQTILLHLKKKIIKR